MKVDCQGCIDIRRGVNSTPFDVRSRRSLLICPISSPCGINEKLHSKGNALSDLPKGDRADTDWAMCFSDKIKEKVNSKAKRSAIMAVG